MFGAVKIVAVPLVAMLVLLVSTPANAGWKIDRATAIAATVWVNPCPGGVEFRWTPLPDGVAAADAANCRLWIGTRQGKIEWPAWCTTIIHEYGHLAGFRDPSNQADPDHSHDPRSVMFAYAHPVKGSGVVNGRRVVTWSGVDPRCRDRGRPYLERHGLL